MSANIAKLEENWRGDKGIRIIMGTGIRIGIGIAIGIGGIGNSGGVHHGI